MKHIIFTLSILLMANNIFAQEQKATSIVIDEDAKSESPLKITHDSTNKKWTISIGAGKNNEKNNADSTVITACKPKKNKAADVSLGLGFDLGFNYLNNIYPTNYTALQTTYITNTFDLNNAKSINVNFWPVKARVNIYKNTLRLQSRLGLQIYNFRFNNDVTFNENLYFDSTQNIYAMSISPYSSYTVQKNKLGVSYLSLPVMLQWRPKIGKNRLHFGAGAMAGYKLKAWTKQVTKEQGKVKSKNIAGFNDYNFNLVGEVGFGKVVLYGTYSLTNMFDKTSLDMRPIAFGIRL